MAKLGSNIIAALDVGSSKIACFIATIDADSNLRVVGIGHHIAKGIKSGTITDIKQAESSVRAAVAAAEKMSGITISKVIVNIAGTGSESTVLTVETPIGGKQITQKDIEKLIEDGCRQFKAEARDIIHCIPIDYSLDGQYGIKNPIGMFGASLGVSLNIVTVSSATLFNLANCLANCHLDVEDYIISPYSSALACLNEDEMELGSVLIDFGGASTSIAIFSGGNMVYTDTIPLGGNNITNDLAICFATNLQVAERVKTVYGNVIAFAKDANDLIEIPVIEDDGVETSEHIQRSVVTNVIKPRVDEIFEMVKDSIINSGFAAASARIKITGGSSQLGGLKDYATKLFERQVRLAQPVFIDGLAESTKGAAFSCCIGILKYAEKKRKNNGYLYATKRGVSNIFFYFVDWLKKNF